MDNSAKILIVGAGPAGLAMAGRLTKAGIYFDIIEKENTVGFMWSQHYDRLHLHTVKSMSALPYFPFPEHYPTFVSKNDLFNYYQDYAKHFNIKPSFGECLVSVTKNEKGWLVKTNKKAMVYQNVVFATGINRIPNYPKFLGLENFEGTKIHSREYKNPLPFKGKKTLVIGMGNTGAEIALDLAQNKVETYVSVRSEVNIVPLTLMGNPTQETAQKLAKLPNSLADTISNVVQKIAIGNLEKYGIKTPKLSPSAQLRETGKTPVIDLGTVAQIKQGKIKVFGDIQSVASNTIRFTDGTIEGFEVLIFATGYKSKLEEFVPNIVSFLDAYGNPKNEIGQNEFEGLFFLGFDNFKPGGILGAINEGSKEILSKIKGKVSINKTYE